MVMCEVNYLLCFYRLWLDDTYANYGGELYLKDWYNNPKVLFDPIVFNALIRHSITGTAQNFDENVVDAVTSLQFLRLLTESSCIFPSNFRCITICSSHLTRVGAWI